MPVLEPTTSSDSITIKLYKDWDDLNVASTVTAVSPSPNSHGLKQASSGLGTCRAVKLRIENVAGDDIHLDTVTFSYYPRRFR